MRKNYGLFRSRTLALAALGMLVLSAALSGCDSGSESPGTTTSKSEAPGTRTPLAEAPKAETPALAEAPAATGKPAPAGDVEKGRQVYDASCVACHAQGVGGAPKLGDKAAWGTRIAQGNDTLYKHAIEGFQGGQGVMPPKGGNIALPDEEVKAAVDYMVSQSQ